MYLVLVPLMHCKQWVWPGWLWYVPRGQIKQLFPDWNVPKGHSTEILNSDFYAKMLLKLTAEISTWHWSIGAKNLRRVKSNFPILWKNNFDFETVLDEKNICGESKQIPYSVTKNCRWANPTFMKKFCLYCIWALLSNFSRLLLQQSGTLWKNFHILFHRKTSIFYLLGQFKPYFR